jgi:hypothetical protein
MRCPKCVNDSVYKDEQRNELRCDGCGWQMPYPDHPYVDPGDGRTQCDTCGKWVWPFTHSCKGIRVAPSQLRIVK